MPIFKKKEDLSKYPTPPNLVGKKVYLRVAEPDDYLDIQRWFLISDPQAMSCRPIPLMTPAQRVERMKKKEVSEKNGQFAIITREDDRLVGHTTFFDYNSLNRSAEIGILIDPEVRRTGYAKDALTALIRYLFLDKDLNKVYAQTAGFNEASRKLLESLEFHLDGTLRRHHRYREELHDDLIFSMLKFECPFLTD